MAKSFIKPENGRQDPNVQTVNGKLALSIPLCQLETAAGASFPLRLDYRSNFLREVYGTWSEEATTGLIAAGWGINIEDRIYIAALNPIKYGMVFSGVSYLLDELETTDNITAYKTHVHSDFVIRHHKLERYWQVFTVDGIEYLFGKDDTYNMEKGTYSQDTGTYTQASAGYTEARSLISSPNAQGIPAKASADNTICRATEQTLFGWEHWMGPNCTPGNMLMDTSAWLLSHIVDRFDNVIAFSYIQHISNLYGNDNAKTYSVASYLYQITSFTKQNPFDKLVFHYSLKDTGEYNVDYTMLERPNGMQQKFEKLCIQKIDHFVAGKELEQFELDYELVNPIAQDGATMVKRQLKKVRFLAGDSADMQHIPAYLMEYYGVSDGVSVGKTGFDEAHPYFYAKDGALYGNLKSITYPSGETRNYQYAQNSLCTVDSSYINTFSTAEEPLVIHTPYDYSIALIKSADKTTMDLLAFTWTTNGWKAHKLGTLKYDSAFDTGRMLSYSEHTIGIIARTGQQAADSPHSYFIFTRNAEAQEIWTARTVFGSQLLYGADKMLHISVTDYGFAVSGLASSTAKVCTIYSAFTQDLGETFKKLTPFLVTDLLPTTQVESDYSIALYMMEDRYLAFVFTNELGNLAPGGSNGSAPQPYRYFSLKIGGQYRDNKALPVSNLGELKDQYISHHNRYTENNVQKDFYSFMGRDVIKLAGIEKIGNLFYIRFETSLQTCFFPGGAGSRPVYKQTTGASINWLTTVMNTEGFHTFKYAVLGDSALKLETKAAGLGANTENPVAQCSAAASGNGITYTYYLKLDGKPETKLTYFCTYSGGHEDDFTIQKLSNDKNICVMKDDTFAVFETETTTNVFRKTYYYYNPSAKLWVKINNGSVSQPSTTYNKGAATALKALGYLGILMFLFTLPFGLADVVGGILTVLSVALTAGSYAAQSLLEKSYKASLNISCSYYGNRFINDGETVWFRENSQDRLTAVGAGEAYQPYDSLSGADVLGDLQKSKQKYGLVYNFIPFTTSQKLLYYRNLKNNAIGAAHATNPFSNGCNDLYYNDTTSQFYFYLGTQQWVVNKAFDKNAQVKTHPYFETVEACALLKHDLSGKLSEHLLTFSGDKFCYASMNATLPPQKMTDVIRGCTMTHVDCAMEKKDSRYANTTQFYLFCGSRYELVDISLANGFDVIERGDLTGISSFLTFDRLDAAFTYLDNAYYVKNDAFIAFNLSTGRKVSSGKLGADLFKMDLSSAADTLNFSHDTLSYYIKPSKTFVLQKHLNGSFHCPNEDYVVDKVHMYTDPRMGVEAASTTNYRYHTDLCSYSAAAGSAVYPEVDICCVEQAAGITEIDGDLYYFDENGNKLSGWKQADGKMYYFDPHQDFKAAKGWIEILGGPGSDGQTHHYYFNPDNAQQFIASGHQTVGGQEFYFSDYGAAMVGVFKTPIGLEYFAPANTNASKNNRYGAAIYYTGWLVLDNNRYYFGTNSKATLGWLKDGEKYYFFKNDGKAATGWVEASGRPGGDGSRAVTGANETHHYYFDLQSAQQLVENGYHAIDGHEFYLDDSGAAMTGVFKAPNGFEYFAPANTSQHNLYGAAIRFSGWLKLQGYYYYFKANSKAATGWFEASGRPDTDGNTYHFYSSPDNAQQFIASGHQVIDGHEFYLNSFGAPRLGVFYAPKGYEYFAPANTSENNLYGAAIRYNGWLDFEGERYYFGTDSKAVTGWNDIDGNSYFFHLATCSMAKGKLMIDEETYFFDSYSGECIFGRSNDIFTMSTVLPGTVKFVTNANILGRALLYNRNDQKNQQVRFIQQGFGRFRIVSHLDNKFLIPSKDEMVFWPYSSDCNWEVLQDDEHDYLFSFRQDFSNNYIQVTSDVAKDGAPIASKEKYNANLTRQLFFINRIK